MPGTVDEDPAPFLSHAHRPGPPTHAPRRHLHLLLSLLHRSPTRGVAPGRRRLRVDPVPSSRSVRMMWRVLGGGGEGASQSSRARASGPSKLSTSTRASASRRRSEAASRSANAARTPTHPHPQPLFGAPLCLRGRSRPEEPRDVVLVGGFGVDQRLVRAVCITKPAVRVDRSVTVTGVTVTARGLSLRAVGVYRCVEPGELIHESAICIQDAALHPLHPVDTGSFATATRGRRTTLRHAQSSCSPRSTNPAPETPSTTV